MTRSTAATHTTATIAPSPPLRGRLRVAGDKSITHRALFFGALNLRRTTIHGASPAGDCARTREVVSSIGRSVIAVGTSITVEPLAHRDDRAGAPTSTEGSHGDEMHAPRQGTPTPPARASQYISSEHRARTGHDSPAHAPALTLDCGNSGTTARLAIGLLAARHGTFVITGDDSLSRRPMERVAEPLRRLGASITTVGGHLPATIDGRELAGGDSHGLIVAESAQVHAALVLAALQSRSGAAIMAGAPMRDHTLRMLRHFGCHILVDHAGVTRILPAAIDRDVTVDVPGDVSSAAFIVAAAVLVPGSDVTIDGVGLNPTRIAFLRALSRLGADITYDVTVAGSDDVEPVGTVTARYSSSMVAARFGDENDAQAPIGELIDEIPLLALVATQCQGRTVIVGASELRIKESDRLASTASALRALGAHVTELDDGLEISGRQSLDGGAPVDAAGDHRIAMMAAVGAMITTKGATISGADLFDVSYPDFRNDMSRLGAVITTS